MTLQKSTSQASRQKACSACIKSKRRCDLHHPACRRCSVKGIDCQYPSTRLHDRQSAAQRAAATSAAVAAITRRANSPIAVSTTESSVDMFLSSHFSLDEYAIPFPSALSFSSGLSDGSGGWPTTTDVGSPDDGGRRHFCQSFLAPKSWTLLARSEQYFPRRQRDPRDLTAAIQHVLRWVKQWGAAGSTTFIHQHLWAERLPKCVQDAYTACGAYFAHTPANRRLVLRILEERVAMLLREQAGDDEPAGGGGGGQGGMASVADHVARVQALLVYQVIRLYDGDASQQAQAAALIPTLTAWNMQMLRCAGLSSEYIQSSRRMLATEADDHASDARKQSAWQAWILAESVRRTWLVAAHVQCIYNALRGDYSLCPGGLMFTTRAGLWDAPSAQIWWDRTQGRDVLFLCSLETGDQLPTRARPEDVDDFGRFVLRIVAGKVRMERWMGKEFASCCSSSSSPGSSDGADYRISIC